MNQRIMRALRKIAAANNPPIYWNITDRPPTNEEWQEYLDTNYPEGGYNAWNSQLPEDKFEEFSFTSVTDRPGKRKNKRPSKPTTPPNRGTTTVPNAQPPTVPAPGVNTGLTPQQVQEAIDAGNYYYDQLNAQINESDN